MHAISGNMLLQVYFHMSLLDKNIQNSSLPQRLKPTVEDIVKKRWEYLHGDIHSAGFCLDPEFWHIELNQEVAFVLVSRVFIAVHPVMMWGPCSL